MRGSAELAATEVVCRVENVSKYFPGVAALKSVSFDIRKGEIHGVIGKNGAGKSTIVNILAGITPLNSGSIWIKGQRIPRNYSPRTAEELSVYLVPQNPLVLPNRSITENLFIGYMRRKRSGLLDEESMKSVASDIIKSFGFQLSPDQEMGGLPIDTQKLLLLGRGIFVANAEIFLLDEITASLNVEGRKKIDDVIGNLVAQGKSIVFISHHLKEVINYCDRVTVFRDGSKVATAEGRSLTEESLASLIIGKELSRNVYTRQGPARGNGEPELPLPSLGQPVHGVEIALVHHEDDLLPLYSSVHLLVVLGRWLAPVDYPEDDISLRYPPPHPFDALSFDEVPGSADTR